MPGIPQNLLLQSTDRGLYCSRGDFYIDPWKEVERAVLTHAHSDHARRGMGQYLASSPSRQILESRLGREARVDFLDYGRSVTLGGVKLSFYPAGHILGSAQIRLESSGEVWVVSGDYKLTSDDTCQPFEPLRCHTFITESTFGLPIYRWPDTDQVRTSINDWWRENQSQGRTTVLFAYALGKAQRILAGLDRSLGPILTHGAVEQLCAAYRSAGVDLPPTTLVTAAAADVPWDQAIVLAPPSANGTPWMRRFRRVATGFASGWMIVRGRRRQRAVDRGFVLSDHADWPGLLSAIEATGADNVLVTHGYTEPLVRWLNEKGRAAATLATHYEGEKDDTPDDALHTPAEGEEA